MTENNEDLRLYTPREVAAEIGSTPTAVKRVARERRATHVRVGGRQEIRFKAEHFSGVRDALGIEVALTAAPSSRATAPTTDQELALTLLTGVQSLRQR